MKLFAKDLREKSKEELVDLLIQYKKEKMLMIQKKQNNIIRKKEKDDIIQNIARINTVIYEKNLAALYEEYKNKDYKYWPKELKPKLTRKLRSAMTKVELRRMKVGKPKYRKHLVFAFAENK